MSNYKIVSGRVFRGLEVAIVEKWLQDNAAIGWAFVSTMPVVEDGHAMYVFQNSGPISETAPHPFALPERSED